MNGLDICKQSISETKLLSALPQHGLLPRCADVSMFGSMHEGGAHVYAAGAARENTSTAPLGWLVLIFCV